jgi:tetraacyldisaccharide 4'-kinase
MFRWYLVPASWLYGIVVHIRNKLFDWKLLPSETFDVPVISVGNITVGGTGKTPHTEYIIDLLKANKKHVAYLSRGYLRKSHGYRLADTASTVRDLGDEACQVWHHHPDIYVAVDANRRRGIHRLCKDNATKNTEVVVLDDAFQHRYVTPGVNILLCDYNRLPSRDALLPAGRLREPFSSRERAHIVIVTKCPAKIRPIDFRITLNHLSLRPFQRLFFTSFKYEDPFALDDTTRTYQGEATEEVLLVCGIASPAPLIEELKRRFPSVIPLTFPDHRVFTNRDMRRISETFDTLPEGRRILITTEKDVPRLTNLPDHLRAHTYVMPVRVKFLQNQNESFDNYIINYVRKNSRNSIVHQRTHARQS